MIIPSIFPIAFSISFVTNITNSNTRTRTSTIRDGTRSNTSRNRNSNNNFATTTIETTTTTTTTIPGTLYYDYSQKKQRIDHGPGSYECIHFYNVTDVGCTLLFVDNNMYRIIHKQRQSQQQSQQPEQQNEYSEQKVVVTNIGSMIQNTTTTTRTRDLRVGRRLIATTTREQQQQEEYSSVFGNNNNNNNNDDVMIVECCLDIMNLTVPSPDWAILSQPTFNGLIYDEYSKFMTYQWTFDHDPITNPLMNLHRTSVDEDQNHTLLRNPFLYHTHREVANTDFPLDGTSLSGLPILFTFPGIDSNGKQDYHYNVYTMNRQSQPSSLFQLPTKECSTLLCSDLYL